jgi:hypothetical protein
MRLKILTNFERERVKDYLKKNGKRDDVIRYLVSRMKRHRKAILEDLALLDDLVKTYDKQKTR